MTDLSTIDLVAALLLAAGLGMRHALDPDHLIAVTALAADRDEGSPWRSATLGFAWGLGHATMLAAAGYGLLWLGWNAELLRSGGFERAVGVVILLIGVRLVLRRHAAHEGPTIASARRGNLLAFATGLVHGLAGSAGVTLALLSLVPAPLARPALLLFAAMTCVSMTLCASLLGTSFARKRVRGWLDRRGRGLIGLGSVLFGAVYAALA